MAIRTHQRKGNQRNPISLASSSSQYSAPPHGGRQACIPLSKYQFSVPAAYDTETYSIETHRNKYGIEYGFNPVNTQTDT